MYLHGGVLGLVVAILPLRAVSELITITQYPSTCSAVYTTPIFTNGSAIFTSGSSSVTVFESTVTVSPVPSPSASVLTDEALNNGNPFVLQIQPGVGGSKRRQAESATWLTAGGWTTTDPSQAVQYRINNGTLLATSGGWISTDGDEDNMLFAISSTLQFISTEFVFENLHLQWNNTLFDDGTASFYTVPAGNGSQQVVVRFRGEVDPRWAEVSFAAQAATGLGIETITPIGSTAVSSAMSMGSMTTPMSSPAASNTVQAPSSTSANVSPVGTCGPDSGFNCYGAPDGSCCSQYGYCGSGPGYCGTGCQQGYGTCDTVGGGSSVAPPVASSRPGTSYSSRIMSSSMGDSIGSSMGMVSSVVASNSAMSSSASFSGPGVLPTMSTSMSISDGVTYSWTITPQPSTWTSGGTTYTALPMYTSGGEPIGSIKPSAGSSAMSMSSMASPSSRTFSVGVTSIPSSSASWSSISNLETFPSIIPASSRSSSSAPSSSASSSSAAGVTLVIISSAASPSASSSSSSSSSSQAPMITSSTVASMSTASSSSSSSNILSSTSSRYLILASPTPCDFGDPPDWNEDDSYCRVDLPQPMTLYSFSNTSAFASSNGFLSLGEGSSQYQVQRFPTDFVPRTTLAPMWDDLFIYREGTYVPEQGIWYQVTRTGVMWEWSVARAGQSSLLYHWTVGYNFSMPGVVEYKYYATGQGENGGFASIGMQGVNAAGTAVGAQVAYRDGTGPLTPGIVLRCDSNANACTRQ